MKQILTSYDVELINPTKENLMDILFEPKTKESIEPSTPHINYLTVCGESMLPKFVPGEICSVRRVNNIDIILYGETYLIQTNEKTDNMVTLKALKKHPDCDKIILKPLNPNFGETVIPKSAIVALYIVTGKITRTML